jgi:prepilin-type N-terminal cleavage/methylation domain-containing protein
MVIPARKKGFTLIEIICVLAIISIIAGIHNLNLSAWSANLKLKIATRELINDLRFSKMYAASNYNSTIKLLFNGEKAGDTFSGYKIYDVSRISGATIKDVKLKENIVIDGIHSTFYGISGGKYIEFHYNGSVSPACTIALKDTINNKLRYITLTIGYTRAMEVVR